MAQLSQFGIEGVGSGIIHPIHTERTAVELIGSTDENYNSYAYQLVCHQLSSFVIDYANDNILMTLDSMLPNSECDDFDAVLRMVIQNLRQIKLHYTDYHSISIQHLCFDGGVIAHRMPRGPILDYPILQHEIVFAFDQMNTVNNRYSYDDATGKWNRATERTSAVQKTDTQEPPQTPAE